MDVFALREKVVSDYKRYIESFVRIRDKRIDEFVCEQLDSDARDVRGPLSGHARPHLVLLNCFRIK